MNRTDELLLTEYKLATEVANHLDTQRNVLTSFFLTLNGGVLITASLVLKGNITNTTLGSPQALLVAVIVAVAVLGTLFVATIARMRRIQIERYHIANRILDGLLLGTDRALIPFGNSTMSSEVNGSKAINKRTTGSYLWTLAVMLPSAGLAGFAIALLLGTVNRVVTSPLDSLFGLLGGVVSFAVIDIMYFKLSKYSPDLPRNQ